MTFEVIFYFKAYVLGFLSKLKCIHAFKIVVSNLIILISFIEMIDCIFLDLEVLTKRSCVLQAFFFIKILALARCGY